MAEYMITSDLEGRILCPDFDRVCTQLFYKAADFMKAAQSYRSRLSIFRGI